MTNSLPGSLGLVHESGWMTASNFNKWMAHSISSSKPFKKSPVLLILDNHQSHLSYEAIEMAKENNVVLLIFPPHVTNHLQPLDESGYEPLKKYYMSAHNGWVLDNARKTISLYQIAGLAARALHQSQTPENIISGFRATGILHYDTNKFTNADFMSATVIDHPASVMCEACTLHLPVKV
ncbi:uncharacterized protein [Watersipora subatra]|uniref:uncharacterized protein n=1 Tax=Watersipora subatra TaxID=2589382 RepID=UPI00355C70E5